MPAPDWTVATPSPTSGAAMDQIMSDQAMQIPQINTDRNTQQRFATEDYTKFQLPQLKSGIAAAGQYYSTARNTAESQQNMAFLHNSYDIQSAANRQLDDLTRQRMYAAMGLVI